MWQGSSQRKSSGKRGEPEISNSRAMGVIVLIALLFVFQVTTFTIQKFRKAGNGPQAVRTTGQESEPVKFAFNPNTVPLDSLQMLGFTQKQAQSVLNYRSKGGKFRVKRDFARLYVVDSAMYSSLEGYLLLPDSIVSQKDRAVAAGVQDKVPEKRLSGRKVERKDPVKDTGKAVSSTVTLVDTSGSVYGRKVERNRYVCNLNTADSAALVRLYGIGGYYAGKILEYRERLGGSFADKRQLLEIKGFSQERYDGIEGNVAVFKEDIKGFSILDAQKRDLERHPYIGKYAARGILLYLELKGKEAFASELQLLQELVNEHIITEDNALRLREYLLHL